jgi:hypothetical protein
MPPAAVGHQATRGPAARTARPLGGCDQVAGEHTEAAPSATPPDRGDHRLLQVEARGQPGEAPFGIGGSLPPC